MLNTKMLEQASLCGGWKALRNGSFHRPERCDRGPWPQQPTAKQTPEWVRALRACPSRPVTATPRRRAPYQEWVLRYRKGLSRGQIADLTGSATTSASRAHRPSRAESHFHRDSGKLRQCVPPVVPPIAVELVRQRLHRAFRHSVVPAVTDGIIVPRAADG
jgi:hypothetical protein